MAARVGVYCTLNEIEDGPSLLGATGHSRPDAFGPPAPGCATSALRDAPVDHHKSDRLLGQIVGRCNTRRGDETEVGVPVSAKTIGHISCLGAHGRPLCRGHKSTPLPFQRLLKPILAHALAPVNHPEHPAQVVQYALCVFPVGAVRERREVLHARESGVPGRTAAPAPKSFMYLR